MRVLKISLILAVALGLGACDRRDSTKRNEPPARQAGRDAYNLKQELKHDAQDAAKGLRKAGKEMREGWNEAKHEDPKHDDRKR